MYYPFSYKILVFPICLYIREEKIELFLGEEENEKLEARVPE
jgi:hypothetical protein